MVLTIEEVDKQINELRQQKQAAIANANALEGAIQILLRIKVHLEAPEPEKEDAPE